MSRADDAKNYFLSGYNCSQAVVLAFLDKTGLDKDTALKLASPFGGGMGRMREVCGTVSGAVTVLGLTEGYSTAGDMEAKKRLYARVQEFARRFRQENGSIVCRELLSGLPAGGDTSPNPEARTPEYYKKRPCPDLAYSAAGILEDMLNEGDAQ